MRATATLWLCAASIVTIFVQPASAEGVEQFTLDNGLTVFLRPIRGGPNVAMMVLYHLGGDHDPAGKAGRAHLLEHIYLTAAAGDAPVRTVEQLFARYPAGGNAQTSFDHTWVATTFPVDRLDAELRDAAGRMADLKITQADLDREKPRVLQELHNMYAGVPGLAGMNHARLHLRPRPDGGRHGGSPEHINTITLEELQQLCRDHYKPVNATLSIAGDFDPAAVRKLVEQYFAPVPKGKEAPAKVQPAAAEAGKTYTVRLQPVIPNAKSVVAIGWKAPPIGSPDFAPFTVVISRLYAGLGGAFDPTAMPIYYAPLDDGTVLILQSPVSPGAKAGDAVKALEEKIKAAVAKPIGAMDRLMAVNNFAMLGTVEIPDRFLSQNPYGAAFLLARRHQLGFDSKKMAESIQKVTDADMKRLAETIFADKLKVTLIAEVP